MAGAGYKLFNTGDVLTAAQVNTYLMEQTVMVFNDAASRTTALTGVVAEGMLSYLKSTKQVEVYNGSAWVASDDPNAIQNTIVDAKGDLITATAADTPARIAVGNNGETLVADSSASTGLRWQGNFAAGKNKIINGDFGIWQRGTSFSTGSSGQYVYTADRWVTYFYGTNTSTVSQQTFTAGTAPVAGYEGQYFLRFSSSNTQAFIAQRIEDVRSFAGQTITVSFWAKAATGTPSLGINVAQLFGSGGSSAVVTNGTTQTLSTSWARYSTTISVPSVSGKTIGAGNYLEPAFFTTSLNNNIDIWGVQVEAGNVATAFQTATGTLAGELAACQRYYERWQANQSGNEFLVGGAFNTIYLLTKAQFIVQKRVAPSIAISSNTHFTAYGTNSGYSITSISGGQATTQFCRMDVEGTWTQGSAYDVRSNTASAFFEFNSEL